MLFVLKSTWKFSKYRSGQPCKESIKFWNVTKEEAANIDFHTDGGISKSRNKGPSRSSRVSKIKKIFRLLTFPIL